MASATATRYCLSRGLLGLKYDQINYSDSDIGNLVHYNCFVLEPSYIGLPFLEVFVYLTEGIVMMCSHFPSRQTVRYHNIKGMFLYSAVYSPSDRSEQFTHHPLSDLVIPTPTRHLWEAF